MSDDHTKKILLGKRLVGANVDDPKCGFIHTFDDKKNIPIFITLIKTKGCLSPALTDIEIARILLEEYLNLTVTKDRYIVPDFFKDSEKSFDSIRRTKEYRLFKKLLDNGMLS